MLKPLPLEDCKGLSMKLENKYLFPNISRRFFVISPNFVELHGFKDQFAPPARKNQEWLR